MFDFFPLAQNEISPIYYRVCLHKDKSNMGRSCCTIVRGCVIILTTRRRKTIILPLCNDDAALFLFSIRCAFFYFSYSQYILFKKKLKVYYLILKWEIRFFFEYRFLRARSIEINHFSMRFRANYCERIRRRIRYLKSRCMCQRLPSASVAYYN